MSFYLWLCYRWKSLPLFYDRQWFCSSLLQNCVCTLSHFSHVWLCATLWTVAHQAPLSIGFSRQAYWSGSPCSPPGDLSDPGIKPMSPALQVASLPLSHRGSPWACLKPPLGLISDLLRSAHITPSWIYYLILTNINRFTVISSLCNSVYFMYFKRVIKESLESQRDPQHKEG